jgi:hypothetical protein
MKKIKYEKRNIFPYGEVLVPKKGIIYDEAFTPKENAIILPYEEIKRLERENESGWLTKAIVDKIKNYDKRKKEKEKELLKLDIEIEQLKKKLKGIKK